ncbi:hypothetical protein ARMSODRAFT_843931, partial [Armillaria solidipes]
LNVDVTEAADNLVATRVAQAHYSNKSYGENPSFKIGEHVMLSTFHQCHDY